eukprot:763310-Hanusia_phi.AAC.8
MEAKQIRQVALQILVIISNYYGKSSSRYFDEGRKLRRLQLCLAVVFSLNTGLSTSDSDEVVLHGVLSKYLKKLLDSYLQFVFSSWHSWFFRRRSVQRCCLQTQRRLERRYLNKWIEGIKNHSMSLLQDKYNGMISTLQDLEGIVRIAETDFQQLQTNVIALEEMMSYRKTSNDLKTFSIAIEQVFVEIEIRLYIIKLHYTKWILFHVNCKDLKVKQSAIRKLWCRKLEITSLSHWVNHFRAMQTIKIAIERRNDKVLETSFLSWKIFIIKSLYPQKLAFRLIRVTSKALEKQKLSQWISWAKHQRKLGRERNVATAKWICVQKRIALGAWAGRTRERKEAERAAHQARRMGQKGLRRRALGGWKQAARPRDGDRLAEAGQRLRRQRGLRRGLGRWAEA